MKYKSKQQTIDLLRSKLQQLFHYCIILSTHKTKFFIILVKQYPTRGLEALKGAYAYV